MYQDINGNQFDSYEQAVRHYGGDLYDDVDDYEEVGDHAVWLYYAQFPVQNDQREGFARCY